MGCYHSTIGSIGSCIESTDVIMCRKDGRSTGSIAAAASSPSCEQKMEGSLGLIISAASALGRRRRRRKRRGEADNECSGPESHKSRLLAADSRSDAGVETADLRTLQSSFRFSFGSTSEAEEILGVPTNSAATTVLLLVNLEENVAGELTGDSSGKEQQQWQRLEVLERSISSAAGELLRFSYAEIRSATRGFHKGRELGRGALSRVYRGRIGVGRRAVAIKKVEGQDRESLKAFCRELMIASSLRNPNVVPLLGFCIDKEGLFLVYKYVSGGSLDHHLHSQEQKKGRMKVLPWEVRYKVAIGIAQALEYLHFGTDRCIIHRDIKPSNILLSSKKTPKLCDFGLATWARGPSVPFLCKSVKGTFGYLAPEYFQHGKLSDKTDVYAFGVVLLELITGRKAIDQSRPQGEENLVLWAKPLLRQGEGAALKLVDPLLKPSSCNSSEMTKMICTATACLNCEESRRPSIDRVIGMLQAEDTCSSDWSIFMGNGCFTYGFQSHDPMERSDMRDHLALAMLGVSDNDEDDLYDR